MASAVTSTAPGPWRGIVKPFGYAHSLIIAEERAAPVVLTALPDEHRITVTCAMLHAVPVAAAKLMWAFGVLAILSPPFIVVKEMMFRVKRDWVLRIIGESTIPVALSVSGNLLGTVVQRENMLIFRVTMTESSLTFAVTVVLTVSAVLGLVCVVEITRTICTSLVATVKPPGGQCISNFVAIPVGRLDTLVIVA